MNQPAGVLGATMRGARWGLPWLSVLVISASVAYAVTVASAGAQIVGEASTTVGAVQAPGQALVAARPAESRTSPSALDRRGSSEVCDTTGGRMLYVGLN